MQHPYASRQPQAAARFALYLDQVLAGGEDLEEVRILLWTGVEGRPRDGT